MQKGKGLELAAEPLRMMYSFLSYITETPAKVLIEANNLVLL